MQELLTLYKLIVLYMLNAVDFPLSKAQLSDFLLEQEYTNFLTLQQAMSELLDEQFIITQEMGNRTLVSITEEGKKTLSYFGNRMNPDIKKHIKEYLQLNHFALRNELSILSNYDKGRSGEYEAQLIAKEKGTQLLNITLSVPTEAMAISICEKWQLKNQEIYQYLTEQLF